MSANLGELSKGEIKLSGRKVYYENFQRLSNPHDLAETLMEKRIVNR